MKTIFAVLLLTSATPSMAEVLSGPAQVVDGDTLEIDGRRIRLFGIDAPELQQACDRNDEAWACGEESRTQLEALIGGQPVGCEGNELDQYDRLVAVCSAGQYELNRTMVEAGWATAFRTYSQEYVAAEVRARGERRGLWRSTFMLPEEFRVAASQAQSEPAVQRAAARPATTSLRPPGACVVKGNRNRRGEWIYHLPGQPYYAQTRAEEMFCTEDEAIAAGYRRSKA